MATRDDVARRAGVSASTVSYVMSGRRTISAATKERVERAMNELNYTPNAFARGLAGSRGGIIALHYPYSPRGVTSTEFEYISAATARARARGYHLLLWSNPLDDVDGLRSIVSQRLVDGVILMELTSTDPRVTVLKTLGVPFATIGRPDVVEGLAFSDNDYDSMGRQAIDHVADLGHTQVMFLSQTVKDLEPGYGPLLRATRSLELPAAQRNVDVQVIRADNSVKGGRYAFEAFASLEPRPTALITFNELATAGFVSAAAMAGVSIPRELTVVALSVGDLAAEMTSPPLTTVSPSSSQIAFAAMDDLADIIEGKTTRQPQMLIAPQLTVRETSAVAPPI